MTHSIDPNIDRRNDESGTVSLNRPESHGFDAPLVLKANDIFLTSDRWGDLDDAAGTPWQGLFCRDTRFLSRSRLRFDGQPPHLDRSDTRDGDAADIQGQAFVSGDDGIRRPLRLHRQLVLHGGLFDRLTLHNPNPVPLSVGVHWTFDADFLDLFEVRGYCDRPQRGDDRRVEAIDGGLHLHYCGLDGRWMASHLDFETAPDRVEIQPDGGGTAIWQLHLAPQEVQALGYRLSVWFDRRPATQTPPPPDFPTATAAAQADWQQWQEQIARVETDRPDWTAVLRRADRDLYLLRQSFGEETVLAAGIPWFSTLFGRDSILAASQTLAIAPQLARDTAIALARHQGTHHSDWHDENPGKILHELRLGEMARCGEIPHTPYFGTADATPLWLLLLADYYAWTGDRATVDRLWDNVLAAMDWIAAQTAETGYVYYLRRSSGGIDNQGWKDSGDCIVNRRGDRVSGAIALCEVQAYVYAALHRWSALAGRFGKPEAQRAWGDRAADLKRRFNREFWLPELGYCALALDDRRRPIDSITSNPGLCLFSGIFEPDAAQAVGDRLMQPDLYSGWGIRTLSSQSPAYDPEAYHRGSVWHHDTAAIAVGLRAIGQGDRAIALAGSLLDMARGQTNLRPPELFCGYPRTSDPPIAYPVACSPQAWATGSLFQMLQMALSPEPNAEAGRLLLRNPRLLPGTNRLEWRGLRVGDARVDLAIVRREDGVAVEVLDRQGDLEVAIVP